MNSSFMSSALGSRRLGALASSLNLRPPYESSTDPLEARQSHLQPFSNSSGRFHLPDPFLGLLRLLTRSLGAIRTYVFQFLWGASTQDFLDTFFGPTAPRRSSDLTGIFHYFSHYFGSQRGSFPNVLDPCSSHFKPFLNSPGENSL